MSLLVVGAIGCSDDANDDGADGATPTTAAGDGTSATTEPAATTTAPPPLVTIEPPPPTTAPPTTADPAAPTTEAAPDGTTTPTTEPPPPAPIYQLDWSALRLPTYFAYDDETEPDDPFWYVHNQASEGFFLSLEMYTTGFGPEWEGETGEFELGCNSASTGICLHFDPDGAGDEHDDLNADFEATGTIVIDQLDDDGYDLVLSDVTFSDGSTIPGPTRLTGP